jgi:hypothetical protein
MPKAQPFTYAAAFVFTSKANKRLNYALSHNVVQVSICAGAAGPAAAIKCNYE